MHSLDPFIIDCHYVHPQFAAVFLLIDSGEAAFVENNTANATPLLLNQLKRAGGADPSSVKYLIVTHVHLDHAGGSSALLKECPNAIILAHPRAAPHLIDPTKLVQSARQVYGEAAFEKLYGEIKPIDSKRVRVIQEGEDVQLGSRKLHFFYTRGHANHHFCVYDSASEGVFTGDSFGLAYPAVQKNGLFIFPSTSPTDFLPEEAIKTVEKILSFKPKKVYLTHFGVLSQVEEAAEQLLKHLNVHAELLIQATESGLVGKELHRFCHERLQSYFKTALAKVGMDTDQNVWELLKTDIELNAAGIAHVAQKKRT